MFQFYILTYYDLRQLRKSFMFMFFALVMEPAAVQFINMFSIRKIKYVTTKFLHYLITDPQYILTLGKREYLKYTKSLSKIEPSASAVAVAVPASVAIVFDAGAANDDAVEMYASIFSQDVQFFERCADNKFYLIDGALSDEKLPLSDVEAEIIVFAVGNVDKQSRNHLITACIALIENGLDIVLVSNSLSTGRAVVVDDVFGNMIINRRVADNVMNGTLKQISFTGKVVRLLPASDNSQEYDIEELLGASVNIDPQFFFESKLRGASCRHSIENNYFERRNKNRPVVFVFPIFLAVGGVERNTIEIMRQLRDTYDFIVVSMERLSEEQGSLSHQASDVASLVIEMAEAIRQDMYLSVLSQLKDIMDPDLVWVCNGSPWFCDNASRIRQLFQNVPIVDQEVYDADLGWIQCYRDSGVREFDHFIAINKKIQSKFLNDYSIDQDRTSLIYSAVDTATILCFISEKHDFSKFYSKYGVGHNKKVYTFVARLSKQKRPLRFLEIAKRRLQYKDECYVFVGDGDLSAESEAFIEENDLTNVVRIPYIENTLELHSISDGIIFTSSYEGLPIAMLEALAMGVPVFSTDVGDVCDVLSKYVAGYVVPVDQSINALLEHFEYWLSNRERYVKSLETNKEKVLDRFSSEAISNQYSECWNNLMFDYERASYVETER